MSIVIRPLRDAELDDADRVLQAAFGVARSFLPMLRLQRTIEPAGLWAADEGGTIVGTAGCVHYGALAYIGLMSVRPDFQRRGTGERLVDHVLRWLDERRCPIALLDATDKGAPLYERFGFVDDSRAYVLECTSDGAGYDAGSQVRRAERSDLDAIVAFDATAFGADRSRLFEALWALHGDRCLVAHSSNDDVRGYLFARDPAFGPWAAAEPVVAESLLKAAMSIDGNRLVQVMVPRSNETCLGILSRHGFVERRRLRHMRRGGQGPPGQAARLYGQSSFGHG